jgi:hypothetical protein
MGSSLLDSKVEKADTNGVLQRVPAIVSSDRDEYARSPASFKNSEAVFSDESALERNQSQPFCESNRFHVTLSS